MTLLAQWILAIMVWQSPPELAVLRATYPEAKETIEEREERYEALANALAEVVATEAPVYSGTHGRAHTAAVLLGISFAESGWRKDVDLGIGPHGRGDGGLAVCVAQVHAVDGDQRYSSGRALDLLSSRHECWHSALRLVRSSWGCRHVNGMSGALAAYASGHCHGGLHESAVRMALAERFYRHNEPPSDKEIEGELSDH